MPIIVVLCCVWRYKCIIFRHSKSSHFGQHDNDSVLNRLFIYSPVAHRFGNSVDTV